MIKRKYHFERDAKPRRHEAWKLWKPKTMMPSTTFKCLHDALKNKPVGTTTKLSIKRTPKEKDLCVRIDYIYARTKTGCVLTERHRHQSDGNVSIEKIK
jgi:hypothetical protein